MGLMDIINVTMAFDRLNHVAGKKKALECLELFVDKALEQLKSETPIEATKEETVC